MQNLATEVKVLPIYDNQAAIIQDTFLAVGGLVGIHACVLASFAGGATTVKVQTTTEDPASPGNALSSGWTTIQEWEPGDVAAADFTINVNQTDAAFVADGQEVVAAQLTCRDRFIRGVVSGDPAHIMVLAVFRPKITPGM